MPAVSDELATSLRQARVTRSRNAAHWQAIIALGNAVKQQALVMGFSDTFAVVGVVLIIAGIAILLTGKPKGGAAAGGGH
jgi:DHA2 family multidrug resistance protein